MRLGIAGLGESTRARRALRGDGPVARGSHSVAHRSATSTAPPPTRGRRRPSTLRGGGASACSTPPLYGHGLSSRAPGPRCGIAPGPVPAVHEGGSPAGGRPRRRRPPRPSSKTSPTCGRSPTSAPTGCGARSTASSAWASTGSTSSTSTIPTTTSTRPATRPTRPWCALRDEGVVGAIGVGTNHAHRGRALRRPSGASTGCWSPGATRSWSRRAPRSCSPAARGSASRCWPRRSSTAASSPPRSRGPLRLRPAPDDVARRAQRMRRSCAAAPRRASLATAALQFPLRHPRCRLVLVGAGTPAEVAEDVDLLGLEIPRTAGPSLAAEGVPLS